MKEQSKRRRTSLGSIPPDTSSGRAGPWQRKKLAKIEASRNRVDRLVDGLGKHIDKGIKETVIYIDALGFKTSMSCEGHKDWGLPWPWVDITAPDRPKERWVGEIKMFEQLAREVGLNLDKNNKPIGKEGHEPTQAEYRKLIEIQKEASRRTWDAGKTEEYKKWKSTLRDSQIKMESLLAEFYQGRKSYEDKVVLGRVGPYNFRLEFEEGLLTPVEYEKIKKEEVVKKLPERRKEMKAFTDFLKKKFWEPSV